jgi:putative transposase
VRRSYKFRLRPTAKQHVALQDCLDVHRALYNAALQERRDAYDRVVKRSPNFFAETRPTAPVSFARQSAQLPAIRAATPEIARFGAGSEQATLRQLVRAFQAFFRRVRGGEEPGYPRFKSADRFDSVTWPAPGDACKWVPDASRVYLQGIGHVKVTMHRDVPGTFKTIQVKREGRRWYLVLSCDDVPVHLLGPTGTTIGVDVGVVSFLARSDGVLIDNPRYAKAGAGRLASAQRALATKTKDSKKRRHAKETVQNRHRKVANQRRDFHHQVARHLVDEFDFIVVEDLKIKSMVRSAKGNIDRPGTNVAAKTGLNRSISDAGWAQFRSILEAKAEDAGRRVVSVNPQHTSQTCAECDHVDPGNRVSQAVFRCRACGHEDHADVIAARNILGAGLALSVAFAA